MDATDKDPSAKATLARLPALDSGLRYCPDCGELEAWCGCEGECCPDCGGEGTVLSDRPGYLQRCPTCHGEGEVYP